VPVSIVIGGQYGSEGKGKVALELTRRDPNTTIVVRPGGTNSGHTGYSKSGERIILRQLPTAAIDGQVQIVFPAGSYIDPDLLRSEMDKVRLPASRVAIDPRAHIIRPEHVEWERASGLIDDISSTGSGTGAAVISRVARYAKLHPLGVPASDSEALQPFLADTAELMSTSLQADERILIEGTQGFGLSLLHSDTWPKCTSRDTSAAGLLSEAGLSPRHVDRIFLVLRCHPIRVAGDSGPLTDETSWEQIADEAGIATDLREFTSVTRKLRRVGRFDPKVVRRAIAANAPTDIVLNHLDYIDPAGEAALGPAGLAFVKGVEATIGSQIHWVGTSPEVLIAIGAERAISA
jgi:adenylosuccinate synthase